jgi:Fe-Mn family superoxide dismutase
MNIVVKTRPFSLPPLPYDEDALAPVISERTMGFHYGKHHRTYVDHLNELVTGTPLADLKLDDIVKKTFMDAGKKKIFNNAAQAWNHTFFWACLTPRGEEPSGGLADAIERDLGGYAKFKHDFVHAGVDQFGSGWVWLVVDKGKLAIESTPDAVTPMAQGKKCILAIDVWEHAYYLDYQDRREEFLKAVSAKLLNWDFARQNFERSG